MNSRGTTTVQGSQQCIQRCQELPINLCIIFGQYILFDQAELYGLFVLFQICSDHHLNLIYIYYCCFWLFELCYVIMSIICVHCIYMCLHIIVHVYLYNYDKMFIDKLQIVLKSLLTCKIHKSALEYSIIRRYTNVVYYYIIIIYFNSSNHWVVKTLISWNSVTKWFAITSIDLCPCPIMKVHSMVLSTPWYYNTHSIQGPPLCAMKELPSRNSTSRNSEEKIGPLMYSSTEIPL